MEFFILLLVIAYGTCITYVFYSWNRYPSERGNFWTEFSFTRWSCHGLINGLEYWDDSTWVIEIHFHETDVQIAIALWEFGPWITYLFFGQVLAVSHPLIFQEKPCPHMSSFPAAICQYFISNWVIDHLVQIRTFLNNRIPFLVSYLQPWDICA